MALTDNQVNDAFLKTLNRQATPYEISQYSNKSIQDLASLDTTYKGYDQNSLAGYMSYNGIDPSTTSSLALTHGIPGYTATQSQNNYLLDALKNPVQSPTRTIDTSVTGSISAATPPQGSIAQAANPPADFPTYTPPQQDPQIADTLSQYKDVQSRIARIDQALANALQDKVDEVARAGGRVSEAELMTAVHSQNSMLLEQRNQLASQQGILGKQYQALLTSDKQKRDDAYKQYQSQVTSKNFGLSLAKTQATTDLANRKQNFTEDIGTERLAATEQNNQANQSIKQGQLDVAKERADIASVKPIKVANYDAFGQKVGESIQIVDLRNPGQKVSVSSSKIGKAVAQGVQRQQDGGFSAGAFSLSKNSLDGLARSYMQGTPIAQLVKGQSKVAAAEAAAIINRAYEMNPNLDVATSQATYKAMQDAFKKLTDTKNLQAGYENKAISQIKMMTDGYTDPVSGKQIPALLNAASGGNVQAINKAYQSFKMQTGNTPAILLSNALITFTTEYAKVMSGGTGSAAASTDSARAEASQLISNGLNKGTIKSVLGELQAEMDTSIAGYDTQLFRLQGNISKIGSGSSAESDPLGLGI